MSATLLLEIGNTAWKLARFYEYQKPEFLAKGYGVDALFSALEAYDYDALALASVGAEEQIERIKLFAETSNKVLYQARTTTGFGVQHCYAQVETLGVDRWLTLLVATSEKTAAIIIDAGTAITLDVIDVHGNHLGGWIAPGMRLMQEALINKSSRLRVSNDTPNELLGTATERAIHLGCRASLNGFVEQALLAAKTAAKAAAKAELKAHEETENEAMKVWLTGGDCQYLGNAMLDEVASNHTYPLNELDTAEQRPDLVLEGLAIWFQHESKRKTD